MTIKQAREAQVYAKKIQVLSWTVEKSMSSTVSLVKDFIGDMSKLEDEMSIIQLLDDPQYMPLVGVINLYGDDLTQRIYADIVYDGKTFTAAISLCELPVTLEALCAKIIG